MKYLFLYIAFLSALHTVFSQNNEPDCGWYGSKTVEERNAMFPFNKAKKVVLVSYPAELEVKFSTTGLVSPDEFVAGCVFGGREIIGNIDVEFGSAPQTYHLYEQKEITGVAISELSNIMMNYTANPAKVVQWEPGCLYVPRNSVLFYDENDTLVADLEICFGCGHLVFLPLEQNPLPYALEMRCPEIMNLLRDFFKANGIDYGIKMR